MKHLIIIVFLLALFSCDERPNTIDQNKNLVDTNSIYNNRIDNSTNSNLNKDTLSNQSTTRKVKKIASNWDLIPGEGWFPESNLEFKRTEEKDFVFIFQENGTVKYVAEDFGDCPVGAFTLKEGTWKMDGDELTLELKGLKIADYWYWWKIKYKIKELTTDLLKIDVITVLKSKEIDPTKTWEDLISE